MKKRIIQYLFITLGVFFIATASYFFVIPINVVAGGSTGLAMIFNGILSKIPISIFTLIFNVTFLILGGIFLGKRYFLNTIYGTMLYPLFLLIFEKVVPNYYVPSEAEVFIFALFGGVLTGIAHGLLVRFDGNSGGTDIPIKIVYKFLHMPITFAVCLVDGSILLLGFIFYNDFSFIHLLYGAFIIYISGAVGDKIMIFGSGDLKVCNIITTMDKREEIKEALFKELSRGITEIEVTGGYSNMKKVMLVTVIANREYHYLASIVNKIDKEAFLYVNSAAEVKGYWASREELYNDRNY